MQHRTNQGGPVRAAIESFLVERFKPIEAQLRTTRSARVKRPIDTGAYERDVLFSGRICTNREPS